jgi:hypothetical protein
MYKVLSAESCSGGDTPDSVSISASQSKAPIKKASRPPSVSLLYPVVKQGGGATVLGEGHDTVNKRNLLSTSFSEHKQLRKAAVLHPASLSSATGAVQTQPVPEHSCAYVRFS